MKTFNQLSQSAVYKESDVSVSITVCGGSYGGGQRGTHYLFYQDVIGALCATDYKWVQQEQVVQGKLIVEINKRNF